MKRCVIIGPGCPAPDDGDQLFIIGADGIEYLKVDFSLDTPRLVVHDFGCTTDEERIVVALETAVKVMRLRWIENQPMTPEA